MRVPFVDLHAQYLSIRGEIDHAIASVIRESGFIRSHFVSDFEERFAAAVGVDRCVSCANGTDAIYILMRGLGIADGDEVITTAHSWISTSETVTQAGGRVVFCDTDRETFTIDPAQIESKITPRTVGIIPVRRYGQPADMDPILDIARRHGMWVIEDCAQAHMAEYRGRRVGKMGTAASFSFYPGEEPRRHGRRRRVGHQRCAPGGLVRALRPTRRQGRALNRGDQQPVGRPAGGDSFSEAPAPLALDGRSPEDRLRV
jgi:dTDP-4-amino-4,6-dideoxygalactose transaminase